MKRKVLHPLQLTGNGREEYRKNGEEDVGAAHDEGGMSRCNTLRREVLVLTVINRRVNGFLLSAEVLSMSLDSCSDVNSSWLLLKRYEDIEKVVAWHFLLCYLLVIACAFQSKKE